MNMLCASICWYLVQLLSSVSYNFSSTGLLHPWLGSFLGILFFLKNILLEYSIYSFSSLLAYKNATDFWILILYTATLLNSLISSNSYFLESLGFSVYSIMSSANTDNFISSFPIWMSFISSSCLIAVVRTSTTVLNKRGRSGHPSLDPNLKENSCSFC